MTPHSLADKTPFKPENHLPESSNFSEIPLLLAHTKAKGITYNLEKLDPGL